MTDFKEKLVDTAEGDHQFTPAPDGRSSSMVSYKSEPRLSLAAKPNEDINKMSQARLDKIQDPVKITFKNINYQVRVKKSDEEFASSQESGKYKQLSVLKNCTGAAYPAQTLFIMGASGAGKTSLLNVLSDRIKVAKNASLTGEVILNDRDPLDSDSFGSYASYVMQDDCLFSYFTVREALTFAARLKLDISIEEQDTRVSNLIH